MGFEQLGINKNLVQLLKRQGIVEPTPIQAACINPIQNNQDVIGQAQTGTGKTLGFLLPIFEKLDVSDKKTQCLILAPTRELALQISEVAQMLCEFKPIGVVAAYGGRDVASQVKKLANGCQLIIATPGRLIDHLERKTIGLEHMKTFVLDEADEMLLMGFKQDIETILEYMPSSAQFLCFSATMDRGVKKLAYRYMADPIVIEVETKKPTLDSIRQQVVETIDREKRSDFCKVVDEDRPYMAIVFCRTKRRAEELAAVLKEKKYDIDILHSDIVQAKRERIMKKFRKGDLQFLIATDIAARGLDVTGITHVYNYDIPESVESYIHRIGRTGRAGEQGYTCVFIDPKDRAMLQSIEQEIAMKLERRYIK